MEEVGRINSRSKDCLFHAMTVVVNFAFWPHYSRERTPVPTGGWISFRKSFAPSGIRTSDRQASSLVTIPTMLLQILPVWRTGELGKVQGSNSLKSTENTPRGDLG